MYKSCDKCGGQTECVVGNYYACKRCDNDDDYEGPRVFKAQDVQIEVKVDPGAFGGPFVFGHSLKNQVQYIPPAPGSVAQIESELHKITGVLDVYHKQLWTGNGLDPVECFEVMANSSFQSVPQLVHECIEDNRLAGVEIYMKVEWR